MSVFRTIIVRSYECIYILYKFTYERMKKESMHVHVNNHKAIESLS